MKPFRKILVPVDFSVQSEQAVRLAAGVAQMHEGTLDIVHIYDAAMAYPVPGGYVASTGQQWERLMGESQERLRGLKELAQACGAVSVETRLRPGVAPVEICLFAREGAFDLIVMGTHGRTGLGHLLLGSVAELVLRRAPCPVLTLRAKDAEAEHAAAAEP